MGADRELYRIGVTPDCPVHQITVGGHCFPRRTEKVTGYGAQTKRNEIQGSIVLLEPGDIDRIRKAAKDRVIRSTRGKRLKAKVYSKNAKNYRPMETDLEVENFLYIKKEETNPIEEQKYATLGESPAEEPKVAEVKAETGDTAGANAKPAKRRGGRIKE